MRAETSHWHRRRCSSALALLLLAGCGGGAPAHGPGVLTTGAFSLHVTADARTIELRRDTTVLVTLGTDAFQLGTVSALDERLSYDPWWLATHPTSAPASLKWRHVTSAEMTCVTDNEVAILLGFEGGLDAKLIIHADGTGRFSAALLPSGGPIAWLRVRAHVPAADAFYGLGEHEDDVNQRGKLRPMQLEAELTSESADNEAHVPVPLLIGTSGWGLFVENDHVGLFDVASQAADLVEVTYGTGADSARGLRFHLLASQTPLDIPRLYYDVTGYPKLPAPWALGPWLWRNDNRDQAEVEDDITKIRSLDLATSGIWLDNPFSTAVNSFDFSATRYPDPARLIRTAHDAGLRMAVWEVPYLGPLAEPLRTEAQSKGYFVPTAGVILNDWGKPIDFTNQAAYLWWQDHVLDYAHAGIEGFKLDYGEDIVPSLNGSRNVWKFANGLDERRMHYGYTLLYHQVYGDTLPADGGFLLVRTGRYGDQQNGPIIWPGDMDATFTKHGEALPDGKLGVGGLPATVIQGLSLSASGFPFFAADTGGYRHSPAGKELYMRWFEQTALSPVMEVGDSASQPPWELTPENGRDQESLDSYRDYARLHLRLFPYEWSYAKALPLTGAPIMRPLGLAYPALGVHPNDTYLFGDYLLVAPVLSAGVTTRRVHLPPGIWLDWWDGTRYDGGGTGAEVEVPAPLGKLPLFLEQGGIVPMLRPTIDTLAPASLPGVESFASDPGLLYVRIAPAAENTFKLWDGATVNMFSGNYDVTPGTVFQAGFVLEIMQAEKPPAVTTDVPLPELATPADLAAASAGWSWESARGGVLWIKVGPGTHHIQTR